MKEEWTMECRILWNWLYWEIKWEMSDEEKDRLNLRTNIIRIEEWW